MKKKYSKMSTEHFRAHGFALTSKFRAGFFSLDLFEL